MRLFPVVVLAAAGCVTIVDADRNVLVFRETGLPVRDPEILNESLELVLCECLRRIGDNRLNAVRSAVRDVSLLGPQCVLKERYEPGLSFPTTRARGD